MDSTQQEVRRSARKGKPSAKLLASKAKQAPLSASHKVDITKAEADMVARFLLLRRCLHGKDYHHESAMSKLGRSMTANYRLTPYVRADPLIKLVEAQGSATKEWGLPQLLNHFMEAARAFGRERRAAVLAPLQGQTFIEGEGLQLAVPKDDGTAYAVLPKDLAIDCLRAYVAGDPDVMDAGKQLVAAGTTVDEREGVCVTRFRCLCSGQSRSTKAARVSGLALDVQPIVYRQGCPHTVHVYYPLSDVCQWAALVVRRKHTCTPSHRMLPLHDSIKEALGEAVTSGSEYNETLGLKYHVIRRLEAAHYEKMAAIRTKGIPAREQPLEHSNGATTFSPGRGNVGTAAKKAHVASFGVMCTKSQCGQGITKFTPDGPRCERDPVSLLSTHQIQRLNAWAKETDAYVRSREASKTSGAAAASQAARAQRARLGDEEGEEGGAQAPVYEPADEEDADVSLPAGDEYPSDVDDDDVHDYNDDGSGHDDDDGDDGVDDDDDDDDAGDRSLTVETHGRPLNRRLLAATSPDKAVVYEFSSVNELFEDQGMQVAVDALLHVRQHGHLGSAPAAEPVPAPVDSKLRLSCCAPRTLQALTGLVGNRITDYRFSFTRRDQEKAVARAAATGRGVSVLELLEAYSRSDEGAFRARVWCDRSVLRIESLVAVIQTKDARQWVAKSPGMARVVSLDSTFSTTKHDAPLFTYVTRHPTTGVSTPVLACILYGGRGTDGFATEALAFMHRKWLDWGNLPVSVFMMDKDPAEWAALLAFHRQLLIDDGEPGFRDLVAVLPRTAAGAAAGMTDMNRLLEAWEGGGPLPAFAPPSDGALRGARGVHLHKVFRPDIVKRFGHLLPSAAALIKERLPDCWLAAINAATWSEYEAAWAPLRRLSSLLRKSGKDISDVAQFFMRHVDSRARLCLWHVQTAVSKKLFNTLRNDRVVKKLTDAFTAAAYATTKDAFDAAWEALLHAVNTHVRDADAAGKIAKYFADNWSCTSRWGTLWPMSHRHFARADLLTTGLSESFHHTYKRWAGTRRSVACVLLRLMGAPASWPPTPDGSRPLVEIQQIKVDTVLRRTVHPALSKRAVDKRCFIDAVITGVWDRRCSVAADAHGVFTFRGLQAVDPHRLTDVVDDVVVTDPVMLRCDCPVGKASVSGDSFCSHVFAAQYLAATAGYVAYSGGKQVVTFTADVGRTPIRSPFEDCELLHILGPSNTARVIAAKRCDATHIAIPPTKALSRAHGAALPPEGTTMVTGRVQRPVIEPLVNTPASAAIAHAAAYSPGLVGGRVSLAPRLVASSAADAAAPAPEQDMQDATPAMRVKALMACLGYSASEITAWTMMVTTNPLVTVREATIAASSPPCCIDGLPSDVVTSAEWPAVVCSACSNSYHLDCLPVADRNALQASQQRAGVSNGEEDQEEDGSDEPSGDGTALMQADVTPEHMVTADSAGGGSDTAEGDGDATGETQASPHRGWRCRRCVPRMAAYRAQASTCLVPGPCALMRRLADPISGAPLEEVLQKVVPAAPPRPPVEFSPVATVVGDGLGVVMTGAKRKRPVARTEEQVQQTEEEQVQQTESVRPPARKRRRVALP